MAIETETDAESRGETIDANAYLRYGATLVALSFVGSAMAFRGLGEETRTRS